MSPEVTAAVIAAGVGLLTVAATVAVQIYSRRATSRDTQHAFDEQRKQLDTTLAAQREQLDRTLAEQRTRTLNERFATAAGQLGVISRRLSGWPGCMPWRAWLMTGPRTGRPASMCCAPIYVCPMIPTRATRLPGRAACAYRASREVRHTVIRVITAHLEGGAAVSWQGLNFDFTGVCLRRRRFHRRQVLRRPGQLHRRRVLRLARSASTAPSSPAARSASATPSSPAARSASTAPSSPAAGQLRRRQVLRRHGPLQRRRVLRQRGPLQRRQVLRQRGHLPAASAGPSPAARSTSQRRVLRRRGPLRQRQVLRRHGLLRPRRVLRRHGQLHRAEFSGGKVSFLSASDWSSPPAFPWTDTPPPGVSLPRP